MGSAFAYAGPTRVAVERISEHPIVNADSVPGYGPIFNAGVIHQVGRSQLFARGVRAGYRPNQGPGDRFLDYISDVLVFASSNSSRYEFQQVLGLGAEQGEGRSWRSLDSSVRGRSQTKEREAAWPGRLRVF